MQTRYTVRILLFDGSGRLLLMQMHDPDIGDADGKVSENAYWLTLGGAIESGETLEQAARRELMEETGIEDARFGPIIWTAEHILTIRGVPRLLLETFIIGFTETGKPSRRGWTEDEKRSVRDLRWWRTSELAESREIFFPARLKEDIPALLAGDYPVPPLKIEI